MTTKIFILLTLAILTAPGPQNASVHPAVPAADVAAQEAAAATAGRTASRTTTEFLGQFEQAIAERLKSAGRTFANSTVAAGPMRRDTRLLAGLDQLLFQQHAQVLHATPTQGQFPQVVALVGQNGKMCSGTLISSTAVLTAAHCACQKATDFVVFADASNGTPRVPAVRTVPMATDCNGVGYQQDDIALTFLPTPSPVPFQALADLSWIKQPGTGTIVGFGESGVGSTGRKQFGDALVVSRECTGATDVTDYRCIAGREVVTSGFLRPDVCDGDSGGPFLVAGPDQKLYLAATISRVVSTCGNGSIYERLDKPRLDWIAKQGVTVQVGP